MAKFILWGPRVLAFVIIVFNILIASGRQTQDAVNEKQTTDFIISLVPAMVLFAGVITGWKHKLTGGIIITTLGVVMTIFLRKYGSLIDYLPLATPVLVTGILYILSYLYEKPLVKSQSSSK